MTEQMKKERARRLFLIAFVLFTFANGFGGSIISNYFKGVYQVDSVQRGLLEIPRELPGVVGVFVITALSGCGNLTLAMISFCLYAVGMFVLGLLSPGYLLMQLFVFTYSLGRFRDCQNHGRTRSCRLTHSCQPQPWPCRSRRFCAQRLELFSSFIPSGPGTVSRTGDQQRLLLVLPQSLSAAL